MPRKTKDRGDPGIVNPDISRMLERLTPAEAKVLLGTLLANHPDLCSEIDPTARQRAEFPSSDEIAADVLHSLVSVDLDALNERAGAHSWGYVTPSDAAMELLEEELQDLVEQMKQNAESGQSVLAGLECTGIVKGLYLTRGKQSDGALGWAPDFPAEHACHVVSELLQSIRPPLNQVAIECLVRSLQAVAPEWKEMFQRIAVEFRT